MKKRIVLLLAFVMALALCGCGKSQAVKDTEALITAIETAESQTNAIAEAYAAYTALTKEEQGKVKNLDLLITARDAQRQETLTWLEGDWVSLGSLLNGFVYNAQTPTLNTEVVLSIHGDEVTHNGQPSSWERAEGGIKLGKMTNLVSVSEVGGVKVLITEGVSSLSYIKAEDVEKVFVLVELTPENISDYMEIINVPCKAVDEFGEVLGEGESYWFASKVYDQGLIYFDSHDLHIEYFQHYREGRDPWTRTTTQLYGGTSSLSRTNGEVNWTHAEEFTLGRVTGTVCYVRAEFAEMVLEDNMRSVKVFGQGHSSRSFYSRVVPQDLEACYF